MAREYRWKKREEWSGDLALGELMNVAKDKVVAGTGPFKLIQDDDVIAENKTRSEVLSRFEQVISNREIGEVFRIRKGDGRVDFTARAVEALKATDSTSGNANSDMFWNWVRTTYAKFEPRYAGSYVCKYVSGSTQRSAHSYGNAVDVFFDTLPHQHEVYKAIKNGKCPVPIDVVICENHDWSPEDGETSYGGQFHAHLHAQFKPSYSGDCGVKGPA